jgi:hypothetical protein
MQIINRNFEFEAITDELICESFLDNFVGLYKAFFDVFEESMQFKTRIKNFLRPTNVSVTLYSTILSPTSLNISSILVVTTINRHLCGRLGRNYRLRPHPTSRH